jgi:type II secretory pathway predicted ATPase ExeA
VEHLHHFKLSEDPFRNEPLLRFLFQSRQQQEALRRMERAARQAKGLCVLIGEVGSGKTMCVRQLLENLEEEVFEASMMVVLNGAADAAWMLTRFARQLGIEEPAREREALLAEVYEQLAIIREDGRHAVLIIDDAQALASPETLAEVCGLLKLEYEDRRLLSLVLAGTPRLAEALASDSVLAHRVDVKVHLEPLDALTAAAYLAHRVQSAGGPASILEPEAVAALHRLGRGVPGMMNTLADNALFEAFLCGRAAVSSVDVERAHADLGWDAGSAQAAPAAPAPPLHTPAAAPPPASTESLDALDSELEAVFEPSAFEAASPFGAAPAAPGTPPPAYVPEQGPPKTEEEEPADLLVELLDD